VAVYPEQKGGVDFYGRDVNGPVTIARGADAPKARKSQHRSIRRGQSRRAPEIREQPNFLQRKFILKPISPVAKSLL
jgi:hypothetical protein